MFFFFFLTNVYFNEFYVYGFHCWNRRFALRERNENINIVNVLRTRSDYIVCTVPRAVYIRRRRRRQFSAANFMYRTFHVIAWPVLRRKRLFRCIYYNV